MLRAILLIGLGGGIGSILRYLTAAGINKYFSGAFPLAIFIVNIIGCLIVGFCLGIFEKNQVVNPDLKLLFVTGFCGGYTTFSTFAYENVNLVQNNNSLMAFVYIAASIVIGMFAVWLGLTLAK